MGGAPSPDDVRRPGAPRRGPRTSYAFVTLLAAATLTQPTEDVPRTLPLGECTRAELAVGVRRAAAPAAVKDGRSDTWALSD